MIHSRSFVLLEAHFSDNLSVQQDVKAALLLSDISSRLVKTLHFLLKTAFESFHTSTDEKRRLALTPRPHPSSEDFSVSLGSDDKNRSDEAAGRTWQIIPGFIKHINTNFNRGSEHKVLERNL